jgi:uncharacterized protein
MRKFRLHNGKQGAALTIRVTPRARKTEVAAILDDGTLRIRVAQPPSEGRANEALIRLMADILGVRRSRIQIIAGQRGLDKIVSVEELSAAEAEDRIQAWLAEHPIETPD